jgi:branched-chain amino acid transport system permease protein
MSLVASPSPSPSPVRGARTLGGLRRVAMPLAAVAIVLALLDGPSYFSAGQLDTAVTLLSLVAIAQAWNIIAGYGGQVSLGVGAFVGTGGYAATLLMIHSGMSFLPALVLAGAIGGALAAVISPAVFRLRGPYFTIGTLGLALAVQAWMENWSFSGGTQALLLPFAGVPTQNALYRTAVVIAALAMLAVWAVRSSDFGLRLMAIRDNEGAAGGLGVPAFRIKTIAFVLSCALTALAGAVIAAQSTSVEPVSAFGLNFTIDAVVMTVVGGIGTLLGPIVGVFIVFYAIQQQLQGSAELGQLLTGLLLILVVCFAPEGAWPLVGKIATAARRRASNVGRLRRERL